MGNPVYIIWSKSVDEELRRDYESITGEQVGAAQETDTGLFYVGSWRMTAGQKNKLAALYSADVEFATTKPATKPATKHEEGFGR